ncbi:nucleobase-ascorbate transporter 12-like isoform X2 [Gastrolobium bilobum]|uniref:nucleobase-ascorbate transporter 12-like isoform X2 n=1 Tax=Gastrolobium bilobum TaxID=150636 RepID=UPI002AB19477|nr:nucleobase-ascorbate transporter 12-like isoform X2 [Gastrolobium bilobum]
MSNSDPNNRHRTGSWPPATSPAPAPAPAPDAKAMPPSSWAKKTGFKPKFSGETNVGDSGQISSLPPKPREPEPNVDLEAGRVRTNATANGVVQGDKVVVAPSLAKDQTVKKRKDSDGVPKSSVPSTNGQAIVAAEQPSQPPRRTARHEEVVDGLPRTVDDDGFVSRHSHMKYELRDSPGLVPIGVYGIQHYVSILGSLILIPLVIVPAMGGTHEDTAMVVSTVLFVSGVTTLLHISFGSRLPLIQGPSFVYLAPALAIINSPEFQGLNGNKFRHIMKELQGAIIIGSAFQALLGYTGLMSLLVRLINPVVVSPTIAAVGISFYSYGFPLVGTCLEIGAVQILVVIVFSLYLRKISVLGHRIFLIYAVPLGLAITWAFAFLLTEAGTYSYKGCDINIPASNMVSEHCRKHFSRMKHCRVDTSQALKSSPWFRFPYPLQWGTPVFHWKMALVMCVVSLISSVDSVGSYHASSLLVASRPPTPGVLSRGIGLEGLSSVLAGLWGTGTGSTTLTENVHTIAVTKMGSRRAVQLGACFLIVLSLVGKVGGFIASIPEVMVAGLLCFMWAMLTALGLSNLRYSEAGSSRNIIIVGLSLFFSLSIPAYFQQYGISPNSNLSVPSYFQPYIVASHGPFRSKYGGLNYVLNTLFSLHMVIAFLVAVILDNTVPGSRQERGVYVWSEPEVARREPAVANDYELPLGIGRIFRWVKWVGL